MKNGGRCSSCRTTSTTTAAPPSFVGFVVVVVALATTMATTMIPTIITKTRGRSVAVGAPAAASFFFFARAFSVWQHPTRQCRHRRRRHSHPLFPVGSSPLHSEAGRNIRQRQRLPSFSSLALFSSSSAAPITASSESGGGGGGGAADNNDDNENPAAVIKAPRKFVPYPFGYRQVLDGVRVEAVTNRGWGIGRVPLPPPPPQTAAAVAAAADGGENNGERETVLTEAALTAADSASDDNDSNNNKKWVVMVPNVIVGEIVKVRVFRNYRNYSEADLVQVRAASPDRVPRPACDLSQTCGGCQYQHMTIESQRALKTEHVRQALEQYGVVPVRDDGGGGGDKNGDTTASITVLPCWGTSHVLGYRSKLTPHFQAPSSRRRPQQEGDNDGGGAVAAAPVDTAKTIQAIGFQQQTSRQIVDVETCPIATDAINEEYRRIRTKLLAPPPPPSDGDEDDDSDNKKKRKKKRNKGATLLLRQANLDDDRIVTDYKESMTTVVNGLRFTYQAGNFFQNNYYVLPSMVDRVVQGAIRGGNSDDTTGTAAKQMTHLVDCYCGSGLFGISAAEHFDTVVGIEINDKAVAEATANAIDNGVNNCQFLAATAQHIFDDPLLSAFPPSRTVCVIDPPRKGCSTEFLEQLYKFAPQRIVYLSCDPTTQARDAASMVNDAGYRIQSVQPFDLFPMTRHIECLMILEKGD